ncbi:hypothetical protein EIN_250090 [Entamoeba invadens IP1]|uniref:SPRY domain-containing protein n=1 Tax=Entamoeba invadens IP1 TaxID=370355 RepID=A0A0A1UEA3_ENTIV|nr:hypothetical protein EIN_250090 [Entamoeba invadens IP1]ELP94915.1 hypothetical protein EIN_250090 [Entamoeba invadens IP1]|eukprot:XP_004261686.1 hypothetical protein EIN_250090 [Entamoeba invadens IP1]
MVKLEMIYLMKVALRFNSHNHLRDFLMISRHCLEAINALKVNPFFTNEVSVVWFFKNFTPETFDSPLINLNCFDLFYKVKQIRNTDFFCVYTKGQLTETFAKNIFPKVTRLVMVDDKNDKRTKFNEFLIEHSEYFTSLYHFAGDLKMAVCFFEKYTEHGNEKYLHLPNLVVLNKNGKNLIKRNYENLVLLERLEKCVPDNNRVSIYVIVSNHDPQTGTLFNAFKKINICYDTLVCSDSEKACKNVICTKGTLLIDGNIENEKTNDCIERTCAISALIINPSNLLNEWTVPSCVDSVGIWSNNNSNQTEQFNEVHYKFPDVTSFSLNNCLQLSFHKVFGISSLTLSNCQNILFGKECVFLSLKKVVLESVFSVTFDIDLSALEYLKIDESKAVSFVGVGDIKEINIRGCFTIDLPQIDFQHKTIYIAQSLEISFENSNPIEFMGKDFNELVRAMEVLFEYPNYRSDLTKFRVHKFLPQTTKLVVVNREILRVNPFDTDETTADMVVSKYFYCEDNKNQTQTFKTPKGSVGIKSLRYFELEVTGFSEMSFGCCDGENYDNDYYEDTHVGWEDGSVGYHSDDGLVWVDSFRQERALDYGNDIDRTVTVGCGYDIKKHTIFFTYEGKIVSKTVVKWKEVNALIALGAFKKVFINYGDKQFKWMISDYEKLDCRVV